MAEKSKNINLNLTPEDEIQQTLFDDWRQSIDGYNGENPVNPSNFEIIDKEIGDIKEALKHISNLHFEIVEELPDVGEPNIIYLILSEESKEKNFYDEYIYIESSEKFELIGSTQITFDDTPTKDSPNAVTSGGVYNALLDKQNIIQDLDTIRSGAQKGETAVQPNDLATVATTGSYNDLIDKPEIPLEQVQSDWKQEDTEAKDYIKNKPNIPAAQVNSDWNAESGVSEILNKPDLSIYAEEEDLSNVAFSGSYNDLTNKPTIPLAQVQSDWNQEDDTQPDYIKHKPDIPSGQVQSNWAEDDPDNISYIQNKPDIEDMIAEEQSRAITVETELETKIENVEDNLQELGSELSDVAFSGSYNDLEDKPKIPLEQIQSDWNQTNTAAKDYIKNKPTIVDPQIAPEFELFKRYVNYLASLHNVELGENVVVEYDDGTQEPIQISYIDYGKAVAETDSGIEQIIVEDDYSSSDAMTESEVNDSFVIETQDIIEDIVA